MLDQRSLESRLKEETDPFFAIVHCLVHCSCFYVGLLLLHHNHLFGQARPTYQWLLRGCDW